MSHYTGSVPATRRTADWRDTALCRKEDPELFFPKGYDGPWQLVIEDAKTVCRRCPVVDACLQFALNTHIPAGIFGGLTDKERDSIRRRLTPDQLNDPHAVAQAAHSIRTPNPERTLHTIWKERTSPLPGGHIGWRGGTADFDGRRYTPRQIAFILDRGRPPVGVVRRTCAVVECVHPRHVADNQERYERQQAAARAEAEASAAADRVGQRVRLAPCGTRSAYQRHLRNREQVDEACRAANTAANGAYLRTGTTKAVAV